MSSGALRRGRALVGAALPLLACVGACARSSPTGAAQPFLFPSRISVQELTVSPPVVSVGAAARIRFRLVRAADDGSPIYWTAHLVERPEAGGRLSAAAGGPLSSGEAVEIAYTPAAPTVAFITLYPSSTAGTPIGDGSGDWRSLTIQSR